MRTSTARSLTLTVSLALALALVGVASAAAESPHTKRVSESSDGEQGLGAARYPSVSASGRFVAFESNAPNLVPDDTNERSDIFVRDRWSGTTTLVSAAPDGGVGNKQSRDASISADGRFVAFASSATDLVPGDTRGMVDVFVRDLEAGTTIRVSISSEGRQGNRASDNPSISGDGRKVAFRSLATNLVPGVTCNRCRSDIFVHHVETGGTRRVNVSSDGRAANGPSYDPAVSADGRSVTFWSYADNLVPGIRFDGGDVFVHDLRTAATTLVSINDAGDQSKGTDVHPAISADGRVIAFFSTARNLAPDDTNRAADVYVHNRKTGRTMRVSVPSGGGLSAGTNLHSNQVVALSPDGQYVAFEFTAEDLVSDDDNGRADIFLHDRVATSTSRISVDSSGGQANSASRAPALSSQGRIAVFHSGASNLVAEDTNGEHDVFMRGPLE